MNYEADATEATDATDAGLDGHAIREAIREGAARTVPTQVAFPFRAALRTAVQALVGVVFGWAITQLPALQDILTEQVATGVSETLTAVLMALAAAAVSWLMSRKGVDRALESVGLSARPQGYAGKHELH